MIALALLIAARQHTPIHIQWQLLSEPRVQKEIRLSPGQISKVTAAMNRAKVELAKRERQTHIARATTTEQLV